MSAAGMSPQAPVCYYFDEHVLGAIVPYLRRYSIDVLTAYEAGRANPEEWVKQALDAPDRTDNPVDGTAHYIKAIPEHGGRFLRVVVNPTVTPRRIATVFFDRRLGRPP
jgi:hypothetical protein